MSKLPKAILFDLDDTLISFNGAGKRAWQLSYDAFFQGRDFAFSREQLAAAISRANEWYWSDPARHKVGRENMQWSRREYVGLGMRELGVDDPALVNELADLYTRLHHSLIEIFPHTIATLEALRSRGVRMGLITNGSSDGQREKLSRFALADYFEIILIDQELGFGKPDVRVFEHALELLDLAAADVWMIGDNLVWDIQPAMKIGIRAIWNDYMRAGLPEGEAIVPDEIVGDISEILRA